MTRRRFLPRRDFLKRTVGASAGLVVTSLGGRSFPIQPEKERLFEISLAQWSLHRSLFGLGTETLDNLDFAETARSFGIEAIEYVNQFFSDKAGDEKYLDEMKRRAQEAGVRSLLIMIDDEGRLGDPDKEKRLQAVENHRRWVAAGAYLGCHSVRVNAASSGTDEAQMELVADGLTRLCDVGDEYGLNIIVENHGGLSSNGAWLAGVMRKVDHPRCGTLPDFGNFDLGDGKQYDRYRGVAELMPYAKAVSAKSFDFDERGSETTIDYYRMMKIVLDAGYNGYVGVEYEGERLDEPAGIRATKSLLERVRDEFSQEQEGGRG
jgi:sugar phosphate isomerase/epimerase